ncbi:hypothetical protein CDL15_Pgr005788 [Punica granatum]|uniref:Uncharacterized protein n=1 Tax=Punica granatum TaxID=22663 RepID=A0A218WHB6_PUNGR|nr:hypothetical protein CDL15_Pgr005788 [Punica granatum]
MKYVAPDDDITTMIERLSHVRDQLRLKRNKKQNDLDYVESARDAIMKYVAPDDDIIAMIERLNQVRDQLRLKWNTAQKSLNWALNVINQKTYIYVQTMEDVDIMRKMKKHYNIQVVVSINKVGLNGRETDDLSTYMLRRNL